jgi:hypothetical protein
MPVKTSMICTIIVLVSLVSTGYGTPLERGGEGNYFSGVLATGEAPSAPNGAAHFEMLSASASVPATLKWAKKSMGKGTYSAIALDPAGNPHIVLGKQVKYRYDLTHSWFDGKRWFSETVDTDVGYDNAVTVDSAGGVHVVYAVEGEVGQGWLLKYAHKGSNGWTVETIEAGGLSNSIITDADNVPHILHVSDALGVRYLKRSGNGWQGETIAPQGLWFGGTSLILHSGNVYATYSDWSLPRKLFLATNETGSWTSSYIDEGRSGSAAFDAAGSLHVVYAESSDNELRHAWRSGANWIKETLVSKNSLLDVTLPPDIQCSGASPSIAIDADGRLHLAFGLSLSKGNAYAEQLVYAMFEGGAVVNGGVFTVRLSGHETALAVSPHGIVHITTTQAPSESRSAILLFSLKGTKLSLAVTPNGNGSIHTSPTDKTCTGKCSELLYPGATVTLTATPATGKSFAGWRGACTGMNPVCSVILDRARSVSARFSR